MKKIIFICFLFFMAQSFVFADEIIDVRGNVTPCKIETIGDGFIEYHKEGNLYSFIRTQVSPIFGDYVDVRITKNFKEISVKRIQGKIIVKDMWGVIIENNGEKIHIPWYKVKSVGVYRP